MSETCRQEWEAAVALQRMSVFSPEFLTFRGFQLCTSGGKAGLHPGCAVADCRVSREC